MLANVLQHYSLHYDSLFDHEGKEQMHDALRSYLEKLLQVKNDEESLLLSNKF